jgi:tetratricopeptide (TPR) repeat protein
LNDGDVLLTGFADGLSGSSPIDHWRTITPAEAVRDLASVGAAGPTLLASLYVMRGADLVRFAAGAESNTDDRPLLEFHGLQHLHAQTDEENMRQLSAFATRVAAPPAVRDAWAHFDSESWARRGAMFEKAESLRLAFESYRTAIKSRPDFAEALAGMIRTARTSTERQQAGTLESLTTQALDSAKNGQQGKAEAILTALTRAYANQPEPWFNYGLFCIERGRYKDAEASFNAAIQADPRYLPAFEAMAETAIRKGDRTQAKAWSRRILQIDPTHAVALQTVANADKAR